MLTRALPFLAILGFCAGSLLPAQSHGQETNSQAEQKPNSKATLKSKSKAALKSKSKEQLEPNAKARFEPNAKATSNSSETRKLAQFHTTRREFKEAIGLWSMLADQKPDAFAEANLGWSYLQLGEKAKAKKHINRSIELNPRTIEGHRYLGYYLMAEGKVPEAVKAFRTSMSFDPQHKCNCGDLEKLVLSKSPKRKP